MRDIIGRDVIEPMKRTIENIKAPFIRRHYKKNPLYYKLQVETKFPIACDSPDHIKPFGSKRDNTKNKKFNNQFYEFAEGAGLKKPYKILDLGCAGGGMVSSFVRDGNIAIGLEGSDYCKKNEKYEWYIIPENLFTCDISKPFKIYRDFGQRKIQMKFDLITAWEVMEHIIEGDLKQLLDNIKSHLGGIFICSVHHSYDKHDGLQYHQTIKPIEWWDNLFKENGFKRRAEVEKLFEGNYLREEKGSSIRVLSL